MGIDHDEKWIIIKQIGDGNQVVHAETVRPSNEWVLGVIASTSMIFFPVFTLLFVKDKTLFTQAMWGVLVGRDIIMLAISTILSLMNMAAWRRNDKVKILVLASVIGIAILHGAFSIAKYLGTLEENWAVLIVNIFVVALTVYIVYQGYRKK